MRLIITILFILNLSQISLGQEHIHEIFKSKRKLAHQYYREKNYTDAADYFMQLYRVKKFKDKDLAILADCFYKINQKNKALEVYQRMNEGNIEFNQKSKNQYFVSMINGGMFREAWRWYQQKDTLITDSVYLNNQIAEFITVDVNSEQNDYGPTAFDLGLLFLSTRPTYSLIATKNRQGEYYPQPYYATLAEDGNLLAQQIFDFPFLPKGAYAGLTTFSQGRKMIVSLNSFDKKYGDKFYSLYYCEKNQNDQWELKNELELGEGNFLQPFYQEKEEKLYFVTDLNQETGTDIFFCQLNNGFDNLSPVRMGFKINTPGLEMYPYVHQDSLLIFASNGHYGLGGLDIYQVNLKEKSPEIKNFGPPVNSPKDDYGLIYYPFSRFGFLSSNRAAKNDDIYKFYLK